MGAEDSDAAAHAARGTEHDSIVELQERIDVLTAFTGGILFEFDRDGRYRRILTGEPQLLVRPAQELMGLKVSEVIGEAAGAQFHQVIRRVYDTGEPTAFDYAADVPAGRRKFSCLIKAHDSRTGEGRRVTALVRDVTVAKDLEAKLVQADRLAALGLLAASVGHEIRQPLSYVLTSLDVLERELETLDLPASARASLENIRGGAQRLSQITSSLDLLAHKRHTSALIDVRRPLQAALDLFSSELSGVRLERRLADVPAVRGNESELCQVFGNLLLNAVQSRQKNQSHTVTVSVAGDPHERVRVSFADNGTGIRHEDVDHLFDPFFTTKRKQGGTGLGLYITQSIVEAHGGAVEVSSEVGVGTTVDVLLPIASGSEPPKELVGEPVTGVRNKLAESASTTKPAAATRRRLSVLVVDDEPRFLESLRLALDDAHHVETRLKAVEALALIEKDKARYDVVLCDLAMPDIDGAAFYERMNALGLGRRFVLMTGGAFTSRAAEFVARKVCRTISKPFLIERLLGLLDEVTRDPTAF